jgi:hypothetical protein
VAAQWILTAGNWESWKHYYNVTQDIGNQTLTWRLFTIKMHIDFIWGLFCYILHHELYYHRHHHHHHQQQQQIC